MSSRTTYCCDRCGKEIGYKPYKIRRFVAFNWLSVIKEMASERELCRECDDNHKKFLKGEKLVCERFDEILAELNGKQND